jgi:hypothetical protein
MLQWNTDEATLSMRIGTMMSTQPGQVGESGRISSRMNRVEFPAVPPSRSKCAKLLRVSPVGSTPYVFGNSPVLMELAIDF